MVTMVIDDDFSIDFIMIFLQADCLQSQVAGKVEIGRPAVRLEARPRRQT